MNGDITLEALRRCQRASKVISPFIIMRPSSLGGGRILLSVCLSVCLSVRLVSGCTLFTVAPSYERTSKREKLRFSLMGQRHVCTFRHAQRAAYRTAISAAQILVNHIQRSVLMRLIFGYNSIIRSHNNYKLYSIII